MGSCDSFDCVKVFLVKWRIFAITNVINTSHLTFLYSKDGRFLVQVVFTWHYKWELWILRSLNRLTVIGGNSYRIAGEAQCFYCFSTDIMKNRPLRLPAFDSTLTASCLAGLFIYFVPLLWFGSSLGLSGGMGSLRDFSQLECGASGHTWRLEHTWQDSGHLDGTNAILDNALEKTEDWNSWQHWLDWSNTKHLTKNIWN